MRILHVVPTFYPATYWGGPIWSTKAICDGIAARSDMELRVLTGDANGPKISDRVRPADLPYPVHYARRIAGNCVAPGLLARLPQAVHWADVVHLTGTYNMPTLPTFLLAGLLRKPLVWSPRGALLATRDWADAPKKRAKDLFEKLANVALPQQSVLHVTAESEAEKSTFNFPNLNCAVIPNAVTLPQVPDMQQRARKGCRLMFLSRLHPKKGLEALFAAMDTLPAEFTLDIYGTGDANYVEDLKTRVAASEGRIRLHGHVDGDQKRDAFLNADLFVLPSHSENFGIVVAEALAHGVSVLTTKATPWTGLAVHGCGRCVDLNTVRLADEIKEMAAQDLTAMGARGRAWMGRDFSPTQMVEAFAQLYQSMGGRHLDAVHA